MTIDVSIDEAQARLPALVEQAIAGDEVIIEKDGKPMVRLTPLALAETKPFQRVLGTAKGHFVVPDDFDDPLPDEILDEFEK